MSSKTDKSAHDAKHDSPSKAESHAKEQKPAAPPPKDLDPPPEPALNQGRVHADVAESATTESPHAKTRIHMDQIDAVATPQGVVLFALTEGGEIWQLTSFAGHQEWTHILTPEAPAEDV